MAADELLSPTLHTMGSHPQVETGYRIFTPQQLENATSQGFPGEWSGLTPWPLSLSNKGEEMGWQLALKTNSIKV